MVENRNNLFEYGGHIKFNRLWAYALFGRMGLVQRKPTTSKSRMDGTDFAMHKKAFLDDLVTTVEMEEIPSELILNWDQTRIRLALASSTTKRSEKALNNCHMFWDSTGRFSTSPTYLQWEN